MLPILAQVTVQADTWGKFIERNSFGGALLVLMAIAFFAWFWRVHVPEQKLKREIEHKKAEQERTLSVNRDARDERQTQAFEQVSKATAQLVPAVNEIKSDISLIKDDQRAILKAVPAMA